MLIPVKTHPGPGLEFTDAPIPSPDPTGVPIKIWSTGICGTDVHVGRWDDWAARTVITSLILRRELYGTIAELGSAVTNLEVGQSVSGEGHYVYGRCRVCLTGKRHLCQ